jgi:hypothetical protein
LIQHRNSLIPSFIVLWFHHLLFYVISWKVIHKYSNELNQQWRSKTGISLVLQLITNRNSDSWCISKQFTWCLINFLRTPCWERSSYFFLAHFIYQFLQVQLTWESFCWCNDICII